MGHVDSGSQLGMTLLCSGHTLKYFDFSFGLKYRSSGENSEMLRIIESGKVNKDICGGLF